MYNSFENIKYIKYIKIKKIIYKLIYIYRKNKLGTKKCLLQHTHLQ